MSTSIQVAYPFTVESLAAQVDVLRGYTFAEPALYREGVKAIATCRGFRVQIEERRKLLKQDSLEYGKKVDAVAKQLVAVIEGVELPLKAAKDEIDKAKERAKQEAAEAERKAVEAAIRAEREAEEAKLRETRKAEEAQLVAQRKELAAEREAAAKERAALQAERDAAAKELAEFRAKQAAAKQERDAKELAERLAAEAEEARINALEYEQARQKRLAALAPDKAKLLQAAILIRALADTLRQFDLSSKEASTELAHVMGTMLQGAKLLEKWEP